MLLRYQFNASRLIPMRQIRHFLILFFIPFLIAGSTAAAQNHTSNDVIFLGTHDVPLMPGFQLEDDQTVDLDKPDGQIAEYIAFGTPSISETMTFYKTAMNEFGWNNMSQNQTQNKNLLKFSRSGDVVELHINIAEAEAAETETSESDEPNREVTRMVIKITSKTLQ